MGSTEDVDICLLDGADDLAKKQYVMYSPGWRLFVMQVFAAFSAWAAEPFGMIFITILLVSSFPNVEKHRLIAGTIGIIARSNQPQRTEDA